MTQLIAGAVVVLGLAALIAIAAAAARRPADEPAEPQPVPVPDGACAPEDAWVPHVGWPTWTICEDSFGFHTCWRPVEHTGRHCAWDLSTGKVLAVWPCAQYPAIAQAAA
jgi:hypothetical protein